MLMLSLSTSGPIASAAVIKDGQVLSREVGGHGRTHSETIMPLCERALQTAGYTPADMDAFGVDAGPGSFTGVRIGICAANAMAAAFGKPVAAASSLEGLLYGIDNACALLDCRNGNGYAMVKYKGFSPEPMAVVIDDLLSTLPDGILMAGDGAVMHCQRILNALPNARFAEDNDIIADRIGLAAYDKFVRGETVIEALPLYLRPSQAERLAKERNK